MTEPPAWVPPVAQPVPPPIAATITPPPPPARIEYPVSRPSPNPGRGPSTLIIVLIVVGVLVALIVGLIALVNSLISSIDSSLPDYPGEPYAPTEPYEPYEPVDAVVDPPPAYPGPGVIGTTLTTPDGVSATLEKLDCGLDGAVGMDLVPEGQFCRVSLVLLNESPQQLEMGSGQFVLFGGDAEYPTVPEANKFADQPGGVFLRPNAEADVFVYFDVPIDAVVDRLVYENALTWSLVPGAEAAPAPTTPPTDTNGSRTPLGTTVVTEEFGADGGLAITVTAVTCGLAEAPDSPKPIEPAGEFCRVDATVENRTDEQYKVSGADFTLLTADSSYTTELSANRYSYQRISDWIQPGETDDCVLFFDVPPETVATGVRFSTASGSGVTFRAE